jgi:hypothetical protein
LEDLRQDDDEFDLALKYLAGDVRDQQRKVVLDLRRALLVSQVSADHRGNARLNGVS